MESRDLVGWCVLWCNEDSAVPVMTSNLADRETAEMYADGLRHNRKRIVAICEANDLFDLEKKPPPFSEHQIPINSDFR